MRNVVVIALVALVLELNAACPPPGCTSQSCPLSQVCDAATSKCVNPLPTEGEGEGTAGEGEGVGGEGEGAAPGNCGDDHFSGRYDDVFVLGLARGSQSVQAIAPVLNPNDFGATFDQANRP